MHDYNKLRSFVQVARDKSVSVAAKRLYRTQSAISQQLKILEDELGVMLFERNGGRIYLTAEGRELYEKAQHVFQALDESIEVARGSQNKISGKITLGVGTTFCDYLIVPLLGQFRELYPNIQVRLVLKQDEEIEDLLLADDIDYGVITTFENRDYFEVEPLIEFNEYMVASQSYLASLPKKKLRYSDVINLNLIDFNEEIGCISRWLTKNSPEDAVSLVSRIPDYMVENYETEKRLALAGVGVAALPEYMMEEELKDGSLIKVFPKSEPTRVVVDLAVRKKKNHNFMTKAFLDFLLSKNKKDSKFFCKK